METKESLPAYRTVAEKSGTSVGARKGPRFSRSWPLHVMLLPTVIVLAIFVYLPMGGVIMAFQNYKPITGFIHSEWVGLEHFRFMFTYPDSKQVILNTIIISSMKFVSNLIIPFVVALLLNEVRNSGFKRSVQTLIYMPYFISWVILGAIIIDMFGPDGLVNRVLVDLFHIKAVFFLGDGSSTAGCWYSPILGKPSVITQSSISRL